MMRKTVTAALVILLALITQLQTGATTCISNKKFKVRAVCGLVTDPTNVPIPDVDVELLDVHSVVLVHVRTKADGHFDIPVVGKGEYVLRAKSKYFAEASQPFLLTKSNAKGRCRPMVVRLEVAGRCSWVSKPK